MSFRTTSSVALTAFPAKSAAESCGSRDRPEQEVIALFEQFRKPLLRYLCSLGLGLADGEEVLQEVFLALFQHLRRGRSRENIRAWLYRVCQNQAMKHRARARQDSQARSEAEVHDLIDPLPGPEEQMSHNQTRQLVWAAVDALPSIDRRCLFLRAEGLRYRDIAKVLDISLGSVSMSLARSLARMARTAKR